MKKMYFDVKNFLEMNKKYVIGGGVVAFIVSSYFVGKHRGVNDFTEELIRREMEYGHYDRPMFICKSDKKKYSKLLFEIRSECLGDHVLF